MKTCKIRTLLAGAAFAVCFAGASSAQQAQDAQLRTFSSWIGDADGDGVSDYAVADPFNGESGVVRLYSGMDHALLRTFLSPVGEQAFGMSIVPSCDMDGDGVPDIGIASLIPNGDDEAQGVIHVYSSVTGKEVAIIKEFDSTSIQFADVNVLGDFNGDRRIDETDLALWLDSMTSDAATTDPMQLDLNKDGTVDVQDIFDLYDRLGYVMDSQCTQAFVNWLNGGGLSVDDPNWQGTGIDPAFQPVPMGFRGCAWCVRNCAKAMKKADACGKKYQNHIANVCGPLADQGLYFEYAECLENARLTFLPTCIANVARAAGKCGTCVIKCAPRPSL